MILDIGCGNWCRGDIGIDISFEGEGGGYFSRVFDKVAGGRNANAQLIKHNLNRGIPIRDGIFDQVDVVHVLEHLKNAVYVTEEIYRVLKPGGILLWIFPNPMVLSADREDKTHIYSWTPFSARNLLRSIGFKHVKWKFLEVAAVDILVGGEK